MESKNSNESNEFSAYDIGKTIGLLGSLMVTNAVIDAYNKSELGKMKNLIDNVEKADKNAEDYIKNKWDNQ